MVVCSRCRKEVPQSATVFSDMGDLLCSNCGAHTAVQAHVERARPAIARMQARDAFFAAHHRALRIVAMLLIVAGLAGSFALFYSFSFGDYYTEVVSTRMWLRGIRAAAMVIPWLVIALPTGLGWFACWWISFHVSLARKHAPAPGGDKKS